MEREGARPYCPSHVFPAVGCRHRQVELASRLWCDTGILCFLRICAVVIVVVDWCKKGGRSVRWEEMIQLLFTLLTGEVAVVLLLIIKNPFRKLVALAIDRIKRGRGPFVVRTVSATVFVLLFSSLHSMFKIQNKSSSTEMGILTPTDQVLWSRHFLESSLMGYSLLLILIIDRTHHFIKEIRRLRKSMEAVVSQSQATDGGKNDSE